MRENEATDLDRVVGQGRAKLRWSFYHGQIEIINNKARHNLIDAKYQQMAFRSVQTTVLTSESKETKTIHSGDTLLRFVLVLLTQTLFGI